MTQSADTLLMIKPSHFGFNAETAYTNTFQKQSLTDSAPTKAELEFHNMVQRLRQEQVDVICIPDDPKKNTPDAVFPNNWISFHENGKVVLYPMATPNRRRERRPEILEMLQDHHQLSILESIDLTGQEKIGEFLEGTGSVVFDHLQRMAYLSRSVRSSEKTFHRLCELLGYTPKTFNSQAYDNTPVYHTNVLMSIGTRFAVVCLNAIAEGHEKNEVVNGLENSNREIIEISEEQMFCFGANVLEVRNSKNEPFIACSEKAIQSLHRDQIKKLERYATLLPFHIPTIETIGGGSVRCMIAEVFLPRKKSSMIVRLAYAHHDLESCFRLRYEILRKPWNQPIGSERDEQESDAWHLLAENADGRALGTARLQRLDPQTGQLRYMAVAKDLQGKGIGKMILQKAETIALENGMIRLFLQARENAVPFYLAHGYRIIEKTFLLYGEIQHFSMEKDLASDIRINS